MNEPAEIALQRLVEGNARFVAGQPAGPNRSVERRVEVARGQSPFAAVLSCSDSRLPPELIFDAGLGDLFVVRTAGQVLDQTALGSLQFGVEELGIPLVMVLGHSRCGAVRATIESMEEPLETLHAIAALVESLRPLVKSAQAQGGDPVETTVRLNVAAGVEYLQADPLVSKAAVVGAIYDLGTGQVSLFP